MTIVLPFVQPEAYGGGAGAQPAANDAAFASMVATGRPIFLSPGTYSVSAPIAMNVSGQQLVGSGRSQTAITIASTTSDLLQIAASHVGVRGIALQRTGGPATAGTGVNLQSGSDQTIEDNLITGFFDNIKSVNASAYTFRNNVITNDYRYGAYIQNVSSPDTNDGTIDGNIFDTINGGSAAIHYESGGGLRVVNNKFLSHNYAVDLQVVDGANTGVLLINSNSMEGQTTASVRLGKAGTTGLFGRVVITGNEINNPSGDGILFNVGAYDLTVSGNFIGGTAGHYGVDCTAGCNYAYIGGNQFESIGTAVRISPTSLLINVGENQYRNVAVPVENNIAADTAQAIVNSTYMNNVKVTSSTTYTNLFQIDMTGYRGCTIGLIIEGIVQGVGQVARYISSVAHLGGGNCALTNISDTSAATAVDVQFDVTTTPGSIIIGVRRNAAAGGTEFDGPVTLTVGSNVRRVRVL